MIRDWSARRMAVVWGAGAAAAAATWMTGPHPDITGSTGHADALAGPTAFALLAQPLAAWEVLLPVALVGTTIVWWWTRYCLPSTRELDGDDR